MNHRSPVKQDMGSRRDVIDEEVEDQITSVSSYLKTLKNNPGGMSFPATNRPWRVSATSRKSRDDISGSLSNVTKVSLANDSEGLYHNRKVSSSIKDIQGMLNRSHTSHSYDRNSVQDTADMDPKKRFFSHKFKLKSSTLDSTVTSTEDTDLGIGSCDQSSSSISDNVSCSSEASYENKSNVSSPKSSFVNRVVLNDCKRDPLVCVQEFDV